MGTAAYDVRAVVRAEPNVGASEVHRMLTEGIERAGLSRLVLAVVPSGSGSEPNGLASEVRKRLESSKLHVANALVLSAERGDADAVRLLVELSA